jgi:hypothetical protein
MTLKDDNSGRLKTRNGGDKVKCVVLTIIMILMLLLMMVMMCG